MKLFGFTIERTKNLEIPAFALPENQDGAVEATSAGGAFASYLDMTGTAKSETDLIIKYREMTQHPECDLGIENIIQEAIVTGGEEDIVSLDLSKTGLSDSLQKKISNEFNHISNLLDFKNLGYDIFRRWYVEGRLFYHVMIDPSDVQAGIQELRSLDSLKIKKVREIKSQQDQRSSNKNELILPEYNEYFLYNPKGLATASTGGIKIATDSIIYCHSGVMNQNKTMIHSYLHKAIKPLNQLTMLEDAVVIYRIARAPERRIFYIDVGNLPKLKAEQYLRDIMTRYKNKMVYDASTGDVQDNRRHQSMMEDYWLPRREGGRGTEISTLPGGQNLGEMEDVEYFKKKLYQSMNVPLSRLEADTPFQLGRASEISRDELKFSRFIDKLRNKFSHLFMQCLEKQLVLKNITSAEEWPELRQNINIVFARDNHFTELKEAELMQERLNLIRDIDEYKGQYYSKEWIRKNILRQSDEEIRREDEQIELEKEVDGMDTDSDIDGMDFSSVDDPKEEPEKPVFMPEELLTTIKNTGDYGAN